MVESTKRSKIIPFLTAVFKLFLLAVIIFVTLTFIPQGQPTQAKAIIAALTVVVYGISDFILKWLLNLICDCEHHRSEY